MPFEPARLFRLALALSLSVSALLFFPWSWHWPLVGDASLIHYIGWLIERGWAPYRQIGDMNMPGSYLIELAAMHLFGTGDLAWRLFDFSLLAATAASYFVITRPSPGAQSHRPGAPSIAVSSRWVGSQSCRLAGLFAACLFILIHGRDGLAEGGQRDLTMAVCLIVATAFLFVAIRRDSPWAASAFGLFSGAALTIKPTALPLTLAQLLLAAYFLRKSNQPAEAMPRRWSRLLLVTLEGYLVAPIITLVFLLREHALAAFFANIRGLVLYYEGLGHRPFGFLLLHSISPLLPLVLLWLVIVALRRTPLDWERAQLLCGTLFGLVSYLVQARGLPYYRYTLLIFLLPLMALDFTHASQSQQSEPLPKQPSLWRNMASRWLAITALAFGGFVLAPQSAVLLHRYRWWETDFITTLQQNLDALGGQRLSGHVQCIDTISGCENVLFRMRLLPANSLLVDFPLFGADDVPFVRQTRQSFYAAITTYPPQVLVVSSALYVNGPGDYRKLDRWPAFQSFLATNYTLQTDWYPARTARWWSREETPAGYRIYVLRPQP